MPGLCLVHCTPSTTPTLQVVCHEAAFMLLLPSQVHAISTLQDVMNQHSCCYYQARSMLHQPYKMSWSSIQAAITMPGLCYINLTRCHEAASRLLLPSQVYATSTLQDVMKQHPGFYYQARSMLHQPYKMSWSSIQAAITMPDSPWTTLCSFLSMLTSRWYAHSSRSIYLRQLSEPHSSDCSSVRPMRTLQTFYYDTYLRFETKQATVVRNILQMHRIDILRPFYSWHRNLETATRATQNRQFLHCYLLKFPLCQHYQVWPL